MGTKSNGIDHQKTLLNKKDYTYFQINFLSFLYVDHTSHWTKAFTTYFTISSSNLPYDFTDDHAEEVCLFYAIIKSLLVT